MKQSDLKNISTATKNIYDYGCYFLDLMYIAWGREPTLEEMLHCYEECVDRGWLGIDCYVKDPCAILNRLTGRSWSVEKSTDYSNRAKFVIGYWFNIRTGLHHFVVMKDKNNVKWDSIYNSKTVAEGVIESYRNIYLEK